MHKQKKQIVKDAMHESWRAQTQKELFHSKVGGKT